MIPTFKNDEEADKFFEDRIRNSVPDSINEDTDDDITLIDLEGEKYEVIDTVEFEGRNYVALLPYREDDLLSETDEFTILEIIDDPDDAENCTLKTVDDEELYDKVGDAFIRQFGQYDEDEE